MFSVVIRNKNEASNLDKCLGMLTNIYGDDVNEIILVDNNSTDDSIVIAKKYNCKIVTIDKFTYGKALNIGINEAKSKYVLLLSSHSMPIGNSFFKNTYNILKKNDKWAGARFINSVANFERAIKNNFKVVNPLNEGLLAACCVINKEVWEEVKFDEYIVAAEDKDWSNKVISRGYEILEINETFLYYIQRDFKGRLKKNKIETIAGHQLMNKKFKYSKFEIYLIFLKNLVLINPRDYIVLMYNSYLSLKTNLEIFNTLNRKKDI